MDDPTPLLRPEDIPPDVREEARRLLAAEEQAQRQQMESWRRGELVDEPTAITRERRRGEQAKRLEVRAMLRPQDRRCLSCQAAFHGSRRYCDVCVTVLLEEWWRMESDQVARQEAVRAAERVVFANLPALVKSYTNLQVRSEVLGLQEAIAAVRKWGWGEGPLFLTLVGGPGIGKSHIAEAALREALARGCRVRWEVEGELLARLRLAVAEGGSVDYEFALVNRAEYLVLDDLGREKGTEWVQAALFRLVNSRYSNARRLLVTTNEDENSMGRKLGAGLADRVFDTGTGTVRVLVLSGPSWRTRGG